MDAAAAAASQKKQGGYIENLTVTQNRGSKFYK